MKKLNALIGILIGLLSIVQHSYGQISEGGVPYSFANNLSTQVSSYNLTAEFKNVESETYIDIIEDDDTIIFIDPVIGEVFPVNLNSITQGTRDTLENGDKIWRLKINSNIGNYMMLVFDDFYLPEGTSLYIYSEDKSQLLGSFTSNNNTPQNRLTTTPLKCNSLILEYYKPNLITEQEHLNIKSIGLITQDFADIMSKGFGDSQDCMINAKCPEYENWCNQRRSVAMIIRIDEAGGQIRHCTGSLLTNERRDGKPFFLTAFHCLDLSGNSELSQSEKNAVQDWVFIFNYQSEGCNNPSSEPSLAYSISGARFLDGHSISDYALLILNQKPPKNYNVYYNGWSNDKDDMTNTGVCIHHPKGDIKKIAKWEKVLTTKIEYWRVKFTAGSVLGGSSGSPLFNSNGLVVGQLKGKPNFVFAQPCDDDFRAYFGCFHRSWHKYSLSWQLNPNQNGNNYINSWIGDETCRDNWHFENGDDLHTSNNVSFLNPATVGTRQYDGVYNAKNAIVAENVTIQAGTSVTFEAGNEIILKSGFHAEAGSNFIAKNGNCEGGCGNGFKIGDESNLNQSDGRVVNSEQE